MNLNKLKPEDFVTPTGRPNFLCDGIVSVQLKSGKHFTYKVELQSKGTLEGKRILSLLTGPDNTSWRDYTGFAFVDDDRTVNVWNKYRDSEKMMKHAMLVAGGADEHVESWKQAGRCHDCGRLLTVPLSIERGYGPECWGRRA